MTDPDQIDSSTNRQAAIKREVNELQNTMAFINFLCLQDGAQETASATTGMPIYSDVWRRLSALLNYDDIILSPKFSKDGWSNKAPEKEESQIIEAKPVDDSFQTDSEQQHEESPMIALG